MKLFKIFFYLFTISIFQASYLVSDCARKECGLLSICNQFSSTEPRLFNLVDIRNKTKEICAPGCWELSKGGYYVPSTTALSSPMIKITGSSIELNFSGHVIENTSTTRDGWIGIEVGYSPAELAANSSLRQPKDIVISHVHLRNFDCSILIHKGVERVVVKDSAFFDTSCGIVILGDPDSDPVSPGAQMNTEMVKDVALVHCKVFGHGKNRRDALVNLKTRIETDYAYTTGVFMPLRADRLDSNTVNAYTYSGLLVTQAKNIFISCCEFQQIGYQDYETSSEGNGLRTEAIGIIFRDCVNIDMQDIDVCGIHSELKAAGLQLERVCRLWIAYSSLSHCNSGYMAVGIESFPDYLAKTFDSLTSGFDFTLEEVDMCHVRSEFQRSSVFSLGMFFTDMRGMNGNKVFVERNISNEVAVGVAVITSRDISFLHSSFCRNIAGMISGLKHKKFHKMLIPGVTHTSYRTVGSLGTDDGIYAIGLYAENSDHISLQDSKCDAQAGDNTARGIHLDTCNSCKFTEVTASDNQIVVGLRSGEAAALRIDQDANEISKHGPSDVVHTGAFGVVTENSTECIFKNCQCNHNNGHRSGGIWCKNTNNIFVDNCTTSYNGATGSLLDSSFNTDWESDPTAIPVISEHAELLFNNKFLTEVNLRSEVDTYLQDMKTLRSRWSADTFLSISSSTLTSFVNSLVNIQGTIARYRLWGTAIGMNFWNCNKVSVLNSRATEQTSEKDSALGIIFTGTCRDNVVDNCIASHNNAWTDSIKTKLENPVEASWSIEREYVDPDSVTDVKFCPATTVPYLTYVAASAGDTIRVWDSSSSSSAAQTLNIVSNNDTINAIAWRPDGQVLVGVRDDGDVDVWDTSGTIGTWSLIGTFNIQSSGPFSAVNDVDWDPTGRLLVTADDNNDVLVWDLNDLPSLPANGDFRNQFQIGSTTQITPIADAHGAPVTAVSWKPDGLRIVSGDSAGEIFLWGDGVSNSDDPDDWTEIGTPVNQSPDGVNDLQWEPLVSSDRYASTRNATIRTWDTSGGFPGTNVDISDGGVTADINKLAWYSDGSTTSFIVTGHSDNSVNVWDETTQTLTQTLAAHTNPVQGVSIRTDGIQLATGSDDQLIIWGQVGFACTYDLSEMFSFWDTITNTWKIASIEDGDIGFYTGGGGFVAQGEQVFGVSTSTLLPTITPDSAVRTLVCPAGPMAAGIGLGDRCECSRVTSCITENNSGNAGIAHGIFTHFGYVNIIQNNIVILNRTNIYGFCAGLFDVNTSTSNAWLQNYLCKNKVNACSLTSSFYNANYVIINNIAPRKILTLPVPCVFSRTESPVRTLENVEVKCFTGNRFYTIDGTTITPKSSGCCGEENEETFDTDIC